MAQHIARTPRVTLSVDITDLNDEQRRLFSSKVTDLLDDMQDYDGEEEIEVLGWTKRTLLKGLDLLEHENGRVQADVIRRAIRNGGACSRAEVYEIGGYDPGRMLRGFTRPVNRVVNRMRAAGEIPAHAVDLLEPNYDSGPVAEGFRVPRELKELV